MAINRRRLSTLAAGGAFVALLAAGGTLEAKHAEQDSARHKSVTPTATATPQEDEEGFNCLIHGNRLCGPEWVLVPEPAIVQEVTGKPSSPTNWCVWLVTPSITRIACNDGSTEVS